MIWKSENKTSTLQSIKNNLIMITGDFYNFVQDFKIDKVNHVLAVNKESGNFIIYNASHVFVCMIGRIDFVGQKKILIRTDFLHTKYIVFEPDFTDIIKDIVA